MKIFVGQIKSIAGDVLGNFTRIQNAYKQASEAECDICLLPELATSGYLAEDLFFSQDFIAEIAKINNKLIKISKNCALILPTLIQKERKLYNSVIVAQDGKILGQTYKAILPNHGIFDEKRYFSSGISQIIVINGKKIAIPICEDIWHFEVCENLKSQGAEIFLVPNASPFELGKFDLRTRQVIARYNEHKIPFVFCNQNTSQDGIVFDGNSFCYDGNLSIICGKFCEDSAVISYKDNKFKIDKKYHKSENIFEDIYQAIKFGLKCYVEDNGFKTVLLGLSGGIDSALVACICADALGASNVTAYMMESKFTSETSKNDAKELIKLLGINFEEIPITNILQTYIDELDAKKSAEDEDLMYQNLQARIRGSILMAQSNVNGSLLITTGNKSEYATGYATIYGDMNGAFNPIKDIYKTQIFALANYRNSISKVIPENIINKAPSAELATNQKDSDSLPDYKILDKILYSHIELNLPKEELYKNFDSNIVDKVIKLVRNSEFKRKQSAPGVKISIRNFEKDRRFPITNLF